MENKTKRKRTKKNKKHHNTIETELALVVFLLRGELSEPAEIVFLCAID